MTGSSGSLDLLDCCEFDEFAGVCDWLFDAGAEAMLKYTDSFKFSMWKSSTTNLMHMKIVRDLNHIDFKAYEVGKIIKQEKKTTKVHKNK